MKQITLKKWFKYATLLALPFIYGCGGGGIAALGSLFGGGLAALVGGGAGAAGLFAQGGGGGEAIAALHNPEPATMVLMGSGMMAMAYFKNRRQKS